MEWKRHFPNAKARCTKVASPPTDNCPSISCQQACLLFPHSFTAPTTTILPSYLVTTSKPIFSSRKPHQLTMADSSKAATSEIENKGKGKGAAEEKETGGMDVDDSSSEEEVDEVRLVHSYQVFFP